MTVRPFRAQPSSVVPGGGLVRLEGQIEGSRYISTVENPLKLSEKGSCQRDLASFPGKPYLLRNGRWFVLSAFYIPPGGRESRKTFQSPAFKKCVCKSVNC